jgi:hypothetical protein
MHDHWNAHIHKHTPHSQYCQNHLEESKTGCHGSKGGRASALLWVAAEGPWSSTVCVCVCVCGVCVLDVCVCTWCACM